ncbi:MAG: UDP-N-acetylmuramoyl-L-alanyl-D-glutamate--2,6-diaminopimelate ligase [Pseudomonadota bacterium]
MILGDLSKDIATVIGDGSMPISGLTADSRKVSKGALFAALPGVKTDGSAYITQAIEAGACAILSTAPLEDAMDGVASVVCDNPRLALAQMAARFHAPQPQTIAAVTGTAGKTSVVAFLRQIWEHAGIPAASLGTTGVVAKGRAQEGELTTPDPVSLAQTMHSIAQMGVTHCAMEASSHGLDQYRLDGMAIAVAGFTNLGRDHMDYHETVEDYLAAKMRLFTQLLPAGGAAIIFADDPFSRRAIDAAKGAGRTVRTVGRKGEFISLKRVEHTRDGQSVELLHDGDVYRVDFPLAGGFQIANGLVAAGMAISTGTRPAQAFAALETLQGAPGRLEKVGSTAQGAPAYVDYAHKPEALENVLEAVRPFTTGRIVTVFGCGGDRDPGKRVIMGEIAQRLSDIVIVTDDNPRTEDPSSIRAQVMAGCPKATEIGDRAAAIVAGVQLLERGDCLIVAGKGHENGQKIGDQEFPFLDHDHVRNALAARAG